MNQDTEHSTDMMIQSTRREWLAQASAAALALTIPGRSWALDLPADLKCVIDAHCHVFNGRDVPAGQFVLDVAAREQGFEKYREIASFVVGIVRLLAPTPEHERDTLERRNPGVTALSDALFHDAIVKTLDDLKKNKVIADRPLSHRQAGFDQTTVTGQALDPSRAKIGDSYVNAPALAVAVLHDTYAEKAGLYRHRQDFVPGRTLGVLTGPKSETDPKLSKIASAMVQDSNDHVAGRPTTDLGPYMAVLRIFLSMRGDNVRKLDATMGFSTARNRLYCPALVDYDCWLDAKTLTKSAALEVQCETMAAVARTTDRNVLVAGYMAFDPLRAVGDKLEKKQYAATALGTVDRALNACGFAGAKLYPPMGFRAWNNKGITDGFGPIAPEFVKSRLPLASKPFDLGKALDDALDEFYKFCLCHDVPILTHCSNSQCSFPGSGGRASPVFWEALLERPGYNHLRVNLGHFGSIWCHAQQTDRGDEGERCRVTTGTTDPNHIDWPKKIVDMVAARNAHDELAYPNLYFDIADLSVLDDAGRRSALTTYAQLIFGQDEKRRKTILSKMMFGTDWMFLALESSYRNFVSDVVQFAKDVGADPADLFWRNAANFLGLRKPLGTSVPPTLARLRAFYAQYPLKRDALDAFLVDAGSAVEPPCPR